MIYLYRVGHKNGILETKMGNFHTYLHLENVLIYFNKH